MIFFFLLSFFNSSNPASFCSCVVALSGFTEQETEGGENTKKSEIKGRFIGIKWSFSNH